MSNVKRDDGPDDRRAASWVEYNLKRSPSNPSEMAIDPNVALANLRKWLVKMKSELPAHDHAMGFTWYPMISDTTGHPVAGMAYIGTICQTKEAWSSSVVEEFGGFSSVGTATHELGHSLGSGHDGVGNIGRQCPGSNNNIMAPGNSGGKNELKNYFSFSWCSLKQFQDLLSSSKADCLFDTQVAGGSHNVVPKVVSSPDKQCKQMFGPKSGFCKMKVLRQELCLRLWCLMPDDHDRCESQGQLAASFGTPCGDQKWCKNGECVFDARAPKDTRCRFGDKNPTYCRNLGAGKEQACKRPDIRKLCCAACAE